MKWFTVNENNSGGSWWLDANDYIALLKTGKWGVSEDSVRSWASFSTGLSGEVPSALRHDLVGAFENADEAIASWQAATGQDIDAKGCECCGQPFYFREAYEGEAKNVIFFDANSNVLESFTLALSAPQEKDA